MITAIFSTTGRSVVQMSDDLYRAYGKTGDASQALNVAHSRWRDNAARGAGPFKPLLFGGYEAVESAADINYQMLKEREPGIEQAKKVLNTDVKGEGITGLSPRSNSGFLPQEEGVPPPAEIRGTELEYIASMAKLLDDGNLRPSRERLTTMGKQVEGYNSFYITPVEERNKNINNVNEERRYQRMFMLTQVTEYEDLISQRIGRPFTFKDFNPKEFLNPLPPEN
jgi:hypothetical protein